MSAGQSAADMAARVRREGRGGLLRRALRVLGVTTARDARAEAQASAWEAGAVGERRTAQLLAPLAAEGWYGFYDRSIPGANRANADHVLVPPNGARLVLVDAKLWSAKRPVHAFQGRLSHGADDRSGCIRSVLYEARLIEAALRTPVVPIVAVHNAPVAGGGFTVDGVRVIPADRLLSVLRPMAGRRSPAAAELAARTDAALPRYVR